ncbi:MAG TPA: (Fe-S)-binding protein [Polyangiaceae bacterium]|nr:(Fe-S)-binding protein [Polyangiaceae bacterium]
MTERRALTILDERRAELETCAFCPKLCRAACPVSDAEASETVTPWGKMGAVYRLGRGAAESTPEYAASAWACTGCFGCKERCEQRNPVAETLYEARASHFRRRLAPPAAERLSKHFPARAARIREAGERLQREHGHRPDAATALLVGCDYSLRLSAETSDAVRAARALFGELRLLSGCCGLSLDASGDPEQAARQRAELSTQFKGASRLVVVDSGCAFALRAAGAVPLARAALEQLERRRDSAHSAEFAGVRYHDPCLLGRGLGEYAAPRELLTLAGGRPPEEFSRRREAGRCSGGGGLVPLTRPETARQMARDRLLEHDRLGGGKIVTACAQSLRSFRTAGAEAIDLATVIRYLAER